MTDLREIRDGVLFLFPSYWQYTFAVWCMDLNIRLGGVFQCVVSIKSMQQYYTLNTASLLYTLNEQFYISLELGYLNYHVHLHTNYSIIIL